jgi:cytochrome o ubiquinol oxidase subunit 1
MTTIETSPDAVVPNAGDGVVGSGLGEVAAWLTSSDHKRIGRLFIGGGLLGALAAIVVGVLLGVERTDGTEVLLDAGALPQLFQAQRIGLLLAGMAPLAVGLAIAVVPLQVGARALAFPRLALGGFYAWLAGVVFLGISLAGNGGIGGGDERMVALFLVGHVITAAGLLAGAGAVATTVLTTRAPGMTMRRVPLFAWSALIMAIGLLLALPVMVGTVIYLYVDYRYARATFGGNTGIGTWVGWFYTQPTTYLFALPALGVFAEVVPVTFRRRQPLRGGVLVGLSLVLVAAFAGVTQQQLHNLPWAGSGLDTENLGDKVADLLPFLLFNGVPLLGGVIVLALGLFTAVGGRPRVTAAFLFAFFGIGMILVGMVGGLLYPIDDLGLQGTVFEEAAFTYIAYGTVLGVLGGVVHWAPKLWGRCLPEKAALPLALLGVLGTILAAFPYYIAGFADQPAGSPLYDYSGPSELWNILVLVGHALMALTVLAVVGLALKTFTGSGESAVDDPWDGQTVEWAIPSPAPRNNFVDVPLVGSPEPLLDLKSAASASTGSPS